MRTKYIFVIALLFMILFSASIPVYATYAKKTQPTELEKQLFDKMFARLEKHDQLIEVKVDDVKKSLSQPVKIFFPCATIRDRDVESVTIDVSTQFVGFDESLAKQHKEGILGATYIWDCKVVRDAYTMTIECTNMLMLNPNFMIKEETENDERKVIAMTENEMILYHEFLHGQLMINAMEDSNDALGWRADACRSFANNNNEIDFSAADPEHKIISGLGVKYLSKLIEQSGGIVIVNKIGKEVGTQKFTQVVARYEELGKLAKSNFLVFARTENLEGTEILVSNEKRTISVSGMLHDPQNGGTVMMFIMPKIGTSNVRIELNVDDPVKSAGSEFVFNAKLQNLQTISITGSIRLSIDGSSIGSKEFSVPAGKAAIVAFTWYSNDTKPSMHFAKVNGLDNVSNEVAVMTFDRLVSATVKGDVLVADQSVVDSKTGKKVTVARPDRISATMMLGDAKADFKLVAPNGTLVIGKAGLVDHATNQVKIVEVGGHALIVKYTDLNQKLRFLAVKSAKNMPLPEGEWLMKAVDISGHDADVKIRYYASYVKTQLSINSVVGT